MRTLIGRNRSALVWILGAGSLAVLGLAYYPVAPMAKVVTIQDGDLSPTEASISPGETVIFRVLGSQPAWPASDFHPEHTQHPDFDPQRPVPPGKQWSFRFDTVGTWKYHDHLRPNTRGTIVVRDGSSPTAKEPACERSKSECWEREMESVLEQDGLAAAFALFAELYATQPGFVETGCHWYAHRLGQSAYSEFRANKPFELTPATAYCGYGFYHGFMETLLHENGDVGEAKKFCEWVGGSLSTNAPLARVNCYHGIGHGFIEDPPATEFWGNARGLVAEPLKACAKISDEPQLVEECSEGIYNALTPFFQKGKYGFGFDEQDPFAFCRGEPAEYRRYCYYEFSQIMDWFTSGDISRLGDIAKEAPDPQMASMIVNTGVAGIIQQVVHQDDFTEYLRACQKLPGVLRIDCARGISGGLMAHGEPEKEYVKTLAYCASPEMAEDERSTCFENSVRIFKLTYSPDKVGVLCAQIPPLYRKFC